MITENYCTKSSKIIHSQLRPIEDTHTNPQLKILFLKTHEPILFYR